MAGLYIHIPFCKSRCIYCGFYSTTNMALRQRYVDAVCKEIVLRGARCEVRDERLETIYLGGGTPSQLTVEQLKQLFQTIDKVYGMEQVKEVTIECNPDDVTEEYAAVLPQLGINRVSMGVQTFDNQRLNFLRRRHTAEQIPVAIQHLRNAGFQNISIDLMYGFPGETLDDWQRDIEAALTLNVEHLSAYCLMVEEGTVLYEQMRNGQSEMNDDKAEELERQMYELLIDGLTAASYEHYEISNFARPGFRSRHNNSYWQDVPYVGIGAAAHSYDGHRRSWNVSDISQYMKGIENGQPAFESEVLDDDTRYNDRITVALRTCEGLRLDELSEQQRNYLLRSARRYVDDGLLQLTDTHIRLTRRGLFVSDMVMSDLMLV
jgi:oxygen-independent coproporphyrinogen-3 oxidase